MLFLSPAQVTQLSRLNQRKEVESLVLEPHHSTGAVLVTVWNKAGAPTQHIVEADGKLVEVWLGDV